MDYLSYEKGGLPKQPSLTLPSHLYILPYFSSFHKRFIVLKIWVKMQLLISQILCRISAIVLQ